jgi:hypothetical protein
MEDFRLLRASRFLVSSLVCRFLPCWSRPLVDSLRVPNKLVNDGLLSSIPTQEDELRLVEDDIDMLWLFMLMIDD